MECNVPVITSRTGSIPEIAEEAALYVSTENPNEMAEQMKRIFKDEQLRNKLIQEGKQRASLFNWDKTVDLLWNTIRQAVSK
jgi:glycosyltransferase involved in cell wall biosynthesis